MGDGRRDDVTTGVASDGSPPRSRSNGWHSRSAAGRRATARPAPEGDVGRVEWRTAGSVDRHRSSAVRDGPVTRAELGGRTPSSIQTGQDDVRWRVRGSALVGWPGPAASGPPSGSGASPVAMDAPALRGQRWREAQPLVTVDQAAASFFGWLLAEPRYYLGIARRWLPRECDAEDLLTEVVLGLCERASRRAHSGSPIRDHEGYLARAVHRAAVHRSRRLRRAEPLHGESIVAVEDVARLAEVNLALEWGRRRLREQLGSGRLRLTLNQYRALCHQERLDARQRAARARGRRLLAPLLQELADRLYDGEPRARVFDKDAVLALLDAIGFFEPDVLELLAAKGGSRGRRSEAVSGCSICSSAADHATDAAAEGQRSRRKER
jgi:hypothetical protein